MSRGTQPSRPPAGGRRRYVDRWIDITSRRQVGVPDSWPEELPLPPAGTSEQTWSTTIAAGCRAEHDRSAAEHAIAAAARHLGLLVGERPHVLEDPEVLPDGRRRYRVRILVTRPDDWTPPGRPSQLPLWDTGQTGAQVRDGAA